MQGNARLYALLVLDVQVGLVHGQEKPWRCGALLATVNELMDKARNAGAPIFLARHVGPAGSPIAPDSVLTQLAPELRLAGGEVVFEKHRPNAFMGTALAEDLRALVKSAYRVEQDPIFRVMCKYRIATERRLPLTQPRTTGQC